MKFIQKNRINRSKLLSLHFVSGKQRLSVIYHNVLLQQNLPFLRSFPQSTQLKYRENTYKIGELPISIFWTGPL